MAASMTLDVGIKGFKQNTNIMDIKVPPQLRVRHETGIDWLDMALGGGFRPSTAMMLTGGPGCGKTTMLLQLAEALTAKGHPTLVNTGEESLYQLRLTTERLKLKHGFICGQDVKLEKLLSHADNIHKAHNKKTVFLLQDSLQTLDDGHYSNGTTGNTPVRCCELLTTWCKDTFNVVVFIGQVNKDGEFNGKNAIKHAVDVHGKLYFDDKPKSDTYGERLFEVNKNRFGVAGHTHIIGIGEQGLYEKGNFAKGKPADLA